MNVRHMVENAEQLIKEGKIKEGKELLQTAYDYIRRMNPEERKDLVAICCFTTLRRENGMKLIHCGEDDERQLFPGTEEERKKLCFECQQWCLNRIREIAEEQKSR